MIRYDAYNSECLVFSWKDGLLAGLAHDLKMRVERFSIEVDPALTRVEATFDPSSVHVVCARVDGLDEPTLLSAADRGRIDENIADGVLQARKHPEIHFESTEVTERPGGYMLAGALRLHGESRKIRAKVQSEGDRWVTEVSIHQQDFGIRPFTAALGALRVKPEVRVRVSVPRDT